MALNVYSWLTRSIVRVLESTSVIPAYTCSRRTASVGQTCLSDIRVIRYDGSSLRNFTSSSQLSIDVSYEQLKKLLLSDSSVVIDVREPWELREYGNIPGSINVPLGQVNGALQLTSKKFLSSCRVQHYPGGWQEWAEHQLIKTKE
uniref:Rhodanese domain-containing protein n=1 Tax=Cyprinus carpio carpio TaxID=630221 RepID=A0A9J8CB72_CYPCA